MGDDLLETPGVVRACYSGDLDGNVVNIVSRHEARHLSQAMSGFFLAEDGLAEEVDVQAVSTFAKARERRAEALIRRVDNEIANDLAEHAAGRRRHSVGSQVRCGRPKPHRSCKNRRKEVLASGRQPLHGCAGHIQIRGSHYVIDESGGEGQTVRIGEDAGQELGRLGCRLVG